MALAQNVGQALLGPFFTAGEYTCSSLCWLNTEKRPARASYCTSVAATSGSRLIPLHATPITASVKSWNRAETLLFSLFTQHSMGTLLQNYPRMPCGKTMKGDKTWHVPGSEITSSYLQQFLVALLRCNESKSCTEAVGGW